ncbi:hypothetical protein [Streptomyces sp. 5-10]|uniref:hypothetical protein n=1 Tax=Streptomyces sp. 5-10 TaxID=878925 RepID=UPI00168BF2D7|nr:hypothetical protein [Streptomyces sp. 5-10]MBD3004788.1 hypothetical protein [Streptomyces sp. 5-10]
MQTLRNTPYVAAYLGVTATTINNWVKSQPEGFILPCAVIKSLDGKERRVWSDAQLTSLRTWVAERLGFDEEKAARHWKSVDDGITENRRVHMDQVHSDQLLFDMSA